MVRYYSSLIALVLFLSATRGENTITTTTTTTSSPTSSSTTTTTTSTTTTTTTTTSSSVSSYSTTSTTSTTLSSSTTLTSTTAIPQNCTWGKNTLGTCGCKPQLFVENTCMRAFYCTDVPDTVENGADYDGCAVECQDNEILIADPRDGGHFYCLTKIGPMPMLCPGGFNTNCGCSGSDAECPIGDCQCQGQLRVNNDCTYARKCNSTAPNDYDEYTCTEGQIVHVNLVNFKISCGEDDGRCPGAFHVGCDQPADNSTTTTTTTSTNPSTTDDGRTTTSTTTTTTPTTTTTTSKASSTEKRLLFAAVAMMLCVSQLV